MFCKAYESLCFLGIFLNFLSRIGHLKTYIFKPINIKLRIKVGHEQSNIVIISLPPGAAPSLKTSLPFPTILPHQTNQEEPLLPRHQSDRVALTSET